MLGIKKIRQSLWKIDPGAFELLNAFKTIIAIIVSILILYKESLITQIMAGVASGFSMQGVVAKTWKSRIRHVFVFDLIYFGAFCLGLLVRESQYLTAIALVLFGFFVNYIRRFNLETSMAPMSAWTLCFLATILPFQTTIEAWQHIYGLITGFVVSAFVIIFVFPENYPRLFVSNSNRFYQMLAQGLKELRQFMLLPEESARESYPFLETKKLLVQLANSNQLIQQSNIVGMPSETISNLLVHQYALLSSYNIMIDAYQTLRTQNLHLPKKVLATFSQFHKRFALALQSICMLPNFSIEQLNSFDFKKLSMRCVPLPTTHPQLIMTLLNVKLSFELLEDHLKQLIRNVEDA